MAQKQVEVPGLGSVLLQKRRGTKNLRLSIAADGRVRVSLPTWAPYAMGIQFARSKRDWIASHRPKNQASQLKDGMLVGKSHRLIFKQLDSNQPKTTSRLSPTEIIIKTGLSSTDPSVQQKALQAAEKALKSEAESLLPARLSEIARKNGYHFKGVKIKKLRSRWGSCSSAGSITLSYYLMQLPWNLIDYVLVHELVHTKHMNHSRDFWAELVQVYPRAKQARREIKKYGPSINPAHNPGGAVA